MKENNCEQKIIAIDIRDAYGQMTGKGFYTRNMVREILAQDSTNKYLLYSNKNYPPFDLGNNAKLITVKAKSIFWHLAVLKDLLKRKIDIFWAPTSYIIPALAPKSLNTIITVHDVIAFLFADKHNAKARYIEKFTLKRALKRTKKILTVSENTAKDVESLFGVKSDKIAVVPCAAGNEFIPLSHQEAEIKVSQLNLPKSFILAVGTIEPRKNLSRLIKAFNQITGYYKHVHLVIVGAKGWQYSEIINEANKNKDKIHFLGYIETEQLVALYSLAAFFVFPSLYEGFGIPPLEAMQCGCPVITSNSSSLPEVVADAAVKISPDDVDSLKKALLQMIENPELSKKYKKEGLLQAKKFSWAKSADLFSKSIKSLM